MKLKTKPSLPELLGERAHLVVAHPGGVPVERGREVVGQHLVGVDRVDGVGELAGVVRGRRSWSPSTGCRRRAPPPATWRWRTGCRRAPGSSPRASWRARSPRSTSTPELPGLLAGRVQRRGLGERVATPRWSCARPRPLVLAERDDVGHRLAVGHQAGLALPGLDELVDDLVEGRVDGGARVVQVGLRRPRRSAAVEADLRRATRRRRRTRRRRARRAGGR